MAGDLAFIGFIVLVWAFLEVDARMHPVTRREQLPRLTDRRGAVRFVPITDRCLLCKRERLFIDLRPFECFEVHGHVCIGGCAPTGPRA